MEHLLYEAVGSCKYPVLVNKSTATGMEEGWFWTAGRPNLKQMHTNKTSREESHYRYSIPSQKIFLFSFMSVSEFIWDEDRAEEDGTNYSLISDYQQ